MVDAPQVLRAFLEWWQEPLLAPIVNPLPGAAALQLAGTAAQVIIVVPVWLKPVLAAAGAVSMHVARHALRAGAAAAPILAPVAPPPFQHMRALWLVLSTVLSVAAPPAFKALQAKAASRQRQQQQPATTPDESETKEALDEMSLAPLDELGAEAPAQTSTPSLLLLLLLLSVLMGLSVTAFALSRRRRKQQKQLLLLARSQAKPPVSDADARAQQDSVSSPLTGTAASRLRQLVEADDGAELDPRRLAFGAEGSAGEAERAAASLRHPQLRRAFTTWYAMASALGRALGLMQRGVGRLMASNLAKGWHSWLELAVSLRAEHSCAERSLRYFLHREVARCWRRWALPVRRGTVGHSRQLAAWLQARRRAAWHAWCTVVAGRQMRAIFDRDRVARSWGRWSVLVMSAADRALIGHAVRIFTHRHVAHGWARWIHSSKRRRTHMRRLRGAARKWLGSRRRAAWSTWLETADERRMLRRAAMYFRSPAARRALESWRQYTEQSMSSRGLLSGALNSLRMLSARRAYNTWAASARLLALAQAFCST